MLSEAGLSVALFFLEVAKVASDQHRVLQKDRSTDMFIERFVCIQAISRAPPDLNASHHASSSALVLPADGFRLFAVPACKHSDTLAISISVLMPKLSKLQVAESPKQLRAMMREQSLARAKERLQALYLYTSGLAPTAKDIARLLGRSAVTVRRWFKLYRDGGVANLLAQPVRTGRPRILSQEAQAKLRERLSRPEGLESYKQLHRWLQEECGIEIHYKTLFRIVQQELQRRPPDSFWH